MGEAVHLEGVTISGGSTLGKNIFVTLLSLVAAIERDQTFRWIDG